MYLSSVFRETRDHRLLGLVRDYPFATLISAEMVEHSSLSWMDGFLYSHVSCGNAIVMADGMDSTSFHLI